MKKILPLFLAAVLGAATLTGCAGDAGKATTAEVTTAAETTTEAASTQAETEASAEAETTASESSEAESTEADGPLKDKDLMVRIGALKGPTTMGLVSLMDSYAEGTTKGNYEITMAAAADELVGKLAKGDLDIALLPANVSSVLYNKTNKGISVIDINTLGVLDFVSGDDSIKTVADLAGKTIYLTGKGTTPDFVMQYLLNAAGVSMDQVTVEYKSEATEVASILKTDLDAVGLLPQPFVTAALAANTNLDIVLNCSDEWDSVPNNGGSRLVTGVTVVRNEFLQKHKEAVDTFLKEHKDSTDFVFSNPKETADMIVDAGIVAKAELAQKALPYCNITCITGTEMKDALSGYLEALYELDDAAVGGELPENAFYYIP